MTSYLDRLNLRPSEKRLVVGVGLFLFVVCNLWFVFPFFSEWGQAQVRMERARKTLATFETEIRQKPMYEAEVRRMQNDAFVIPAEDQTLHFQNTVQAVASQSGVIIGSTSKISTKTNQFFLELSETASTTTKEQQLVDFLYRLGSSNSLIRVRDLTLRPDPPRQQLSSNIKLVASYQKKAPAKPVTPAVKPPAGRATAPTMRPAPQGPKTPAAPAANPAGASPRPAAPTSKKP